jgi:hypothetical protein
MIKQNFGKHIASAFLLLFFVILAVGSTDSETSSDPNAWKTKDNKSMAYMTLLI